MTTRVLAIETATEACSAALLCGGEVAERFEVAPRRHAELVLPMVERLLAEAGAGLRELDGIGVGRGPGAFTGVRIATAVVQGLALAADLPVVPVSTLAAIAQGAVRDDAGPRVLAAIDARMGEVYWGAFVADGDGLVEAAGEESVAPPDRVPTPPGSGRWFGAGTGWGSYHEALRRHLGDTRVGGWEDDRLPRARDVVRLAAAGLERGGAVAPERAVPVYLRDRVAQVRRA